MGRLAWLEVCLRAFELQSFPGEMAIHSECLLRSHTPSLGTAGVCVGMRGAS